jgi:hypothetical protein
MDSMRNPGETTPGRFPVFLKVIAFIQDVT